jgi:hypothetical protein
MAVKPCSVEFSMFTIFRVLFSSVIYIHIMCNRSLELFPSLSKTCLRHQTFHLCYLFSFLLNTTLSP